MDYKYRGTFVISAENTRLIPGKGYEVYHCDRVRSLLDDINMKGKSMYAKVQEIQFPEVLDLDWSIRFTEYNPNDEDITEANLTNTVTSMFEIPKNPEWTAIPQFLQDWVAYWKEYLDYLKADGGMDTAATLDIDWDDSSKRLAFCYHQQNVPDGFNCIPYQYRIEFGIGLQYQFGFPPCVGRDGQELYKDYPTEPEYRERRMKLKTELKTGETNHGDVTGNEGYVYIESTADYNKYKADALTKHKEWVILQKELRSRIMGNNVQLGRNKDEIPAVFETIHEAIKGWVFGIGEHNAIDGWIFNCGIVDRNQLTTTPPTYLYFSHADLCGNSLNLQRSTCLVDYPGGTVYDSRDEYLYVHNCSPFPNITFTAYAPKACVNGAIEYSKYLFYPNQFYVIIDYFEA